MLNSLHWVRAIEPARLALSARPRGGDDLLDELHAWRSAGVEKVVSLLESREARELELAHEQAACAQVGILFVSSSIPDRGLPSSRRDVFVLTKSLAQELQSGVGIALHCRAGIGRTGLIAACVLRHLGIPSAQAFQILSKARGVTVPDTNEQAAWVAEFCKYAPSAA